jgi:putative hemolysin
MLYIELLIAAILIVINGILSMSELAVVSARRGKLKSMADAGSAGAATALVLAGDPGRFLSTVQIGITLVGILAGAFSGATLGARMAVVLVEAGIPQRFAEPIAYGGVVAVITYLSLIIGELVPKQIALRNAEGVAAAMAPAMALLARISAPLVWLLDVSGKAMLGLLGGSEAANVAVTTDEIKALIADAESSGAIEPRARGMISGVIRLGDRTAQALMTPRPDLDVIDLRLELPAILQSIAASVHSRFPICDGSDDLVPGVIRTKDLLDAQAKGGPVDVRSLVRPAPIIQETMDALDVVDTLKKSAVHMALVHDEYGDFVGIVTTADILEAIAGAFRTDDGEPEPEAVERNDGSWLISGSMPFDELAELLGLPAKRITDFHTAAGMVLSAMRRLPMVGETVDIGGWQFEVLDMDGRRIDKLLATRLVVPHRHLLSSPTPSRGA